jgi:hypothetical protein
MYDQKQKSSRIRIGSEVRQAPQPPSIPEAFRLKPSRWANIEMIQQHALPGIVSWLRAKGSKVRIQQEQSGLTASVDGVQFTVIPRGHGGGYMVVGIDRPSVTAKLNGHHWRTVEQAAETALLVIAESFGYVIPNRRVT